MSIRSKRSRLCAGGVLAFSFACSSFSQVNVLTANYGNERTNANLQETTLSVSNVSPAGFGRIASVPVDGQIYAQPLYVSGVHLDRGMMANIVYVATMHNTMYAIRLDDPANPALLWQVNFGPPVPSSFLNFEDISPEIGILSTPVIDASRKAMYLVTDTFENGAPVFRLHALDIANGSEILGGPIEIKAAVSGIGIDSTDGRITFDPVRQLQRPGLLLLNGKIYLGFGSHADLPPYHGWLMSYDASDLQNQIMVLNLTPQGGAGSVWQSGRGLAAGEDGNIYIATGNGDYDGQFNFSQSLMKLSPDLSILDWFAPADWKTLGDADYDVGTAGPMVLPGGKYVIGGDKMGNLYLVNPQSMGHLGAVGDAFPQITSVAPAQGIFNYALWIHGQQPIVYVVEVGVWTGGVRILNGSIESTPFTQSPVAADGPFQGMAISANGSTDGTGILWMTTGDHSKDGVPGTLHAFDALDLTHELWNSDMNPRDQLGSLAKFANPTVVNGYVYVPTFSNRLMIYGLFSTAAPPSRRPVRK